MMQFQGLPVEWTVGTLPLRPCSPCFQLRPCAGCHFVKLNYFLCDKSDHVTCNECSLPDNKNGQSRWCTLCDRFVSAKSKQVPIEYLRCIKFECQCGVKDSLSEIRKHLRRDGPHRPSDRVNQNVKACVPSIPTRNHIQTFDLEFGLPRHDTRIRNCRGYCEMFFKFDTLYSLFLERKCSVRSNRYSVIFGNLPFESQIVLDEVPGMNFLTVITMVSADVNEDVPLPLRGEVTLKLLENCHRRTPLADSSYIKRPTPIDSHLGVLLTAQFAVVAMDVARTKLVSAKTGEICVAIELNPLCSTTSLTKKS